MLAQLDHIPAGLLEVAATDLHRILPGSALLHLPGRDPRPLFVSVLLHGNETAGLLAIQAVLKKYEGQTLPRSLSIFFGNVEAARFNARRLDGQCDYNRIWPGGDAPDCAETRMARAVLEEMAGREIFAAIDVHNNTGLNPHYACVNRLDDRFLQLAAMFGRLVVHFNTPKGVLSTAFAELCPSVTLECGKPGQPYGVEHAFAYLDACLHLSEIPDHGVARGDLDLYHTVAKVTVREEASFGFGEGDWNLALYPDIERHNFAEMAVGTAWGAARGALPVLALDEEGRDVSERYFAVEEGELILREYVMPSMLSPDITIIRQDCLCYLMKRMAI
jgi:succinylglutamate desuccinylase